MPSITQRRDTYAQAIRKASTWLVNTQEENGSYGAGAGLGDVETVAICLSLAGYPDRASRLLRYIKKAFFKLDGSFLQPTDENTMPEWVYAPSWVVYSAHLNDFFEISQPGMAAVLRFQDPKTGGIFGHPQSQRSGTGVIVLSVTAVAGTAALQTGHLAAAQRIGDYFLHLIAIQPDPEKRFYPFYDTRYGLITEGTAELGPTYFGTLERDKPKQHYWILGFLMAFLSDLYLATGQKRYLDGAWAMFEFGEGGNSDLYSNTLNHKYLWGCARLFHATGDTRVLEAALRIADFLVAIQEPEGTWWHSGFIASRDQQTKIMTIDGTSQFCIWLIKLLQVL
jgi:hypothetical protein